MPLSTRKLTQRRLDAARGYLQLSMPQQALLELKRVPDREICRFELNLLCGEAHRDLQDYPDAEKYFQIARDERPQNLQSLLGIAWCQKRLDRLSDAIETLELAKQFHPDEPIVVYNLACYFSLAGDKPRALECLGRSLRMEPELLQLIPEESDFDPLRDDPDFRFVAESVADAE